jgi:hypothetical protein
VSESGLWKYLRSHVPGVDWVRVENPVHPGTPDVNYAIDQSSRSSIDGWTELKWVPHFPRKPTKPVFGDKKGLNVAQVRWIKRRTKYGGRVWIVAGVGKLIYFLHGSSYADSFNQLVTADFESIHPMWVLRRNGDAAFEAKVIRLLTMPGRRPLGLAIRQPGSIVSLTGT